MKAESTNQSPGAGNIRTNKTCVLSQEEMGRYRRDGYLYPIDVLTNEEVRQARARVEAVEAAHGGSFPRAWGHKPHVIFPWLDALVAHPAILDVIEGLLGPDILCWSSRFFIKAQNDGGFVSWHQDLPYWGLDASEGVVTAWLALSPATRENGVMKVIPGSHRKLVRHREAAANNLLRRGQEVAVEVDENAAVAMELAPGQMSLHHGLIFHGSDESHASERRIGYAIRYIPASLRTLKGLPRDTATLVRGEDRHGNFELLPRPSRDLDPVCVEAQKRASEISEQIRDMAAQRHDGMVPGM